VSLKITVDPASATVPFEQLRQQIAGQARSGALPVGYRMPTVRGLAGELGLAANTVAKAYRVLEADGVIETRGRKGTFIAAAGDGRGCGVRTARPPPGPRPRLGAGGRRGRPARHVRTVGVAVRLTPARLVRARAAERARTVARAGVLRPWRWPQAGPHRAVEAPSRGPRPVAARAHR
jgi:DNA-binding transcriptional MocR family regulator